MISKLKYNPDLERLNEKELQLLQKLCDSIKTFVKRSPEINKVGRATRDAHATTYSLVKGTFQVDESFEGKNIFPAEELNCIIRISNPHMKIVS